MKKQDVEFKVGKDTLRGTLFIPDGKGPFPAVILFHGSESTGDTNFELAEKLAQQGIVGFAFNYRGCGISDGDIKQQTIGMGLDDVEAAMKVFLSQKEVDKNRLGLLGGSYGGFLASLVVNRYNIKSLVLSVPAAYDQSELSDIHGAHLGKNLRHFTNSLSYKEIAKFKGYLLIIQAENDEILPAGMVEKYFESAALAEKKEKLVLKNTRHQIRLNPDSKSIFIQKVISWFVETL